MHFYESQKIMFKASFPVGDLFILKMTKNATLILDSFSTFLKCIMINACHNNPMTSDEAMAYYEVDQTHKRNMYCLIMFNSFYLLMN